VYEAYRSSENGSGDCYFLGSAGRMLERFHSLENPPTKGSATKFSYERQKYIII
jgi:hypothetical protein